MVTPKKGRKKVAIETLDVDDGVQQLSASVPEHQPDPDNLLEFQIKNALQFKHIFDIVKDVHSDTCLTFTPEGMKLTTADELVEDKINVIVYLCLDPQYFEYYHCNVDYLPIGVDLTKFQTIVSPVKTNWTLRWTVTKAEPTKVNLVMRSTSGDNNVRDSFQDKLIEPIDFSDASLEYDFPPAIQSDEFRTICKKLYDSKLKEVRIIIDGDQVLFKSTKTDFQWGITCDTSNPDDPDALDDTEVAEGVFNVAPLKNFSKSANVTTRVKLYLQTDSPLICEYEMHSNGMNCGSLKYLLIPIPE